MRRSRSNLYDKIEIPTSPELLKMYMNEGLGIEEATKRADELHRTMDNMGRAEARFWKYVRENENTAGLCPETTDERSVL
jgi:hypothetical protein